MAVRDLRWELNVEAQVEVALGDQGETFQLTECVTFWVGGDGHALTLYQLDRLGGDDLVNSCDEGSSVEGLDLNRLREKCLFERDLVGVDQVVIFSPEVIIRDLLEMNNKSAWLMTLCLVAFVCEGEYSFLRIAGLYLYVYLIATLLCGLAIVQENKPLITNSLQAPVIELGECAVKCDSDVLRHWEDWL